MGKTTIRSQSDKTRKYLEAAEIKAFMSVIKRPRDKALFLVAITHGLRASEIGMIQMYDVDVRQMRLTVRRLKGSRGGQYLMMPDTLKALKAWLKVRGDAPGALFLSREGYPISRKTLDYLMKRYAKKAGLPPTLAHFHALKHSCATQLLEIGREITEVQDRLGHVNIQNTMIYAHVTNARRQRSEEAIAREWKL
jgi:integrase